MRNEPCHGCEHVIYPYPYDPAFVCDSQLRCGYHGGTAEIWCDQHEEHPNYVPLLQETDYEDSRS